MALSNVKANVQTWFKALDAKKRANVVKGSLVMGVLAVLFGMYYLTGRDKIKPPEQKAPVSTINVGDKRLEDDLRAAYTREERENRAENRKQDEDIKEVKKEMDARQAQLDAMQKTLEAFAKNKSAMGLDLPENPPDGVEGNSALAASKNLPMTHPANWQGQGKGGEPLAPMIEYIGDIEMKEVPPPKGGTTGADGKKKNPRFYLPAGFMEAKLLSGVNAKTVENAKGDPEPVMMRVQAPAVLPNEVRAALDGCFVVAHGYGSLASERFEARLVSLNCLDFEKRSVIEADITGVVLDNDGKKGIVGRPVAKMGANMGRLFLAGTVEGAARAFSQSAMVTSISPLGQTQTIDADHIGRAAAGQGLSSAAGEMTKIYSDLVRQSAPVLEVGTQKDVTVMLTQGAWLEIKPVEDGI